LSFAELPMGPSCCEIARLPVELLSAVISRAAPRPRDACRASAVSPAFRAAADSDDVWSRFLPRDVPDLADGELSPPPPSNKALFLRLSGSDGNVPLLLPDRLRVRTKLITDYLRLRALLP
jgi:hypothetical protein